MASLGFCNLNDNVIHSAVLLHNISINRASGRIARGSQLNRTGVLLRQDNDLIVRTVRALPIGINGRASQHLVGDVVGGSAQALQDIICTIPANTHIGHAAIVGGKAGDNIVVGNDRISSGISRIVAQADRHLQGDVAHVVGEVRLLVHLGVEGVLLAAGALDGAVDNLVVIVGGALGGELQAVQRVAGLGGVQNHVDGVFVRDSFIVLVDGDQRGGSAHSALFHLGQADVAALVPAVDNLITGRGLNLGAGAGSGVHNPIGNISGHVGHIHLDSVLVDEFALVGVGTVLQPESGQVGVRGVLRDGGGNGVLLGGLLVLGSHGDDLLFGEVYVSSRGGATHGHPGNFTLSGSSIIVQLPQGGGLILGDFLQSNAIHNHAGNRRIGVHNQLGLAGIGSGSSVGSILVLGQLGSDGASLLVHGGDGVVDTGILNGGHGGLLELHGQVVSLHSAATAGQAGDNHLAAGCNGLIDAAQAGEGHAGAFVAGLHIGVIAAHIDNHVGIHVALRGVTHIQLGISNLLAGMRGIFHSHVRQVEDDRIGDVVLRVGVNNGAGVPLAVQALDLHGGEGVLIGGNHSELAHVAASLRGDVDCVAVVSGDGVFGTAAHIFQFCEIAAGRASNSGIVNGSDSQLSAQRSLVIITGQLHVDGFGDIVDGSAHHTLAGHIGLGQVCGGAALHFFQSQGVGAQLHVIPGTVGSTQVIQRQLDGVAVYQVVIQG